MEHLRKMEITKKKYNIKNIYMEHTFGDKNFMPHLSRECINIKNERMENKNVYVYNFNKTAATTTLANKGRTTKKKVLSKNLHSHMKKMFNV